MGSGGGLDEVRFVMDENLAGLGLVLQRMRGGEVAISGVDDC